MKAPPFAGLELVLHKTTVQQLAQCIASPPHAILLVGSNGSGKTTLAKKIIARILGVDHRLGALASYPYYTLLSPANGKISIGVIRELQHFLQLKTLRHKTLGERAIRRATIIEHAETLTTEAQNALLKLLEEPPADTVILLTADSQRSLLPTIVSRTQVLVVHAPPEEKLKTYFQVQGKEASAVERAYFLSGGLPGLMHALLDEGSEHPLTQGVMTAKDILRLPTFERLTVVENLSKRKEEARYTLDALQHIALTGLDQAAQKGDQTKTQRWYHILKVAAEARKALARNANSKLVLDKLMLAI